MDETDHKRDRDYLKGLGVSDGVIRSSEEWQKRGLLKIEIPEDLVERTMEKCRPKLEKMATEARSRKRMENSCFSRLYDNLKRQIYHYLFK